MTTVSISEDTNIHEDESHFDEHAFQEHAALVQDRPISLLDNLLARVEALENAADENKERLKALEENMDGVRKGTLALMEQMVDAGRFTALVNYHHGIWQSFHANYNQDTGARSSSRLTSRFISKPRLGTRGKAQECEC
ncbi:hypothetical protein SCHPADRAFT_146035 [Schizopora paradoxa]|uniref:Uncharacterized protein n=1 Tax=Schizopora paradoxa TaxID=27342 RepID=A0A0H2S0L1_9AGAM|nr:hypothetical protein SCHPADRAFT_146035 [Schizopora paradoxa]